MTRKNQENFDVPLLEEELPQLSEGSGSTGILLSTLWNQSGVISLGSNKTITYNEYTPIDPTVSKHSVTGCTNTAAGQIIYYYLEKHRLSSLSLTLTSSDAYTSVKGSITIAVKADGSTSGTISFSKVNSYLSNYNLNSAVHAAALIYACGVVQEANYSFDGTSTSWSTDLFYRSGFQGASFFYGSKASTTYFWGKTNASGTFTLSDAGFEVIIENLLAGRPVGTSYPGHALVIDGYDADRDLFHINFGWGSSSTTRWYSRSEMRAQEYHEFVFDLFTERVETFTVTDGRFYGTGTMARAFEQARGFLGSNIVRFSYAVSDASLELSEFLKVEDTTTVKYFNMTVKVTGSRNWSWGAAFYGEAGSVTSFEQFRGSLIVNTGLEGNVGFYFASADKLSLSTYNALIYAGSYSGSGSYSGGASSVLTAMRTARNNGSAPSSFVTNAATTNSYSVYGSNYNDSVVFAGRSLVVGDVYLKNGQNLLKLTGYSRLYGDVLMGSGSDTVTIADHSQITGDISLSSGSDSLSVLGGSYLYGNISGSGSNTVTIDSSSSVSGIFYASAAIKFVLNSSAGSRELFLVKSNAYNINSKATKITVDLSDASVGTYTLFAADSGASYAEYLNQLTLTITGTGQSDYTLSGSGTSTSKFANVFYENRKLKLTVNVAPSSTLPKVTSVSADITSETRRKVTVRAVFNSNVKTAQYSLDGSTWKSCTAAGVAMSDNGTVYFRGIGANGSVSRVVSYDVTNIIGAYGADIRSDLMSNGYSQIVGWDSAQGKVGYMAANGAAGPAWRGIWEWSGSEAAKWKVVGVGHFRGSGTAHDGILLYNGNGNTFAAWTNLDNMDYGYVSLCHVDGNFQTKTLTDLDGDAFDDVLIYDNKGSFGVVLDAAEYHDIWHVTNASTNVWQLVGSGDFGAADGKDSLLVKKTSENAYFLWHNNDSTFKTWNWSQTYIGSLNADWSVAGIGDFSGDGIDDIAMWRKSTGEIQIWENGKSSNQRYAGSISQSSWEVAAVGDYNSDGREDLLLREKLSGWGGLGYWADADATKWTDLNARIETNMASKFTVIA